MHIMTSSSLSRPHGAQHESSSAPAAATAAAEGKSRAARQCGGPRGRSCSGLGATMRPCRPPGVSRRPSEATCPAHVITEGRADRRNVPRLPARDRRDVVDLATIRHPDHDARAGRVAEQLVHEAMGELALRAGRSVRAEVAADPDDERPVTRCGHASCLVVGSAALCSLLTALGCRQRQGGARVAISDGLVVRESVEAAEKQKSGHVAFSLSVASL